MSYHYRPLEIEPKWRKIWEDHQHYHTDFDASKPSIYVLEMFPYPSGKLHMGHVRNYALGDILARYKRMTGHNVLYPMGFDSFGLPAENAAIKQKIDPEGWTLKNIDLMVEQQQALGFSYDWSRKIATSTPEYYRWNQWLFIHMFNKGLIYRKKGVVNWDPVDHTVLANEQVIDGKGWRSGAVVEQREIEQWYLKITDYAEELLQDLDTLDHWPEPVKQMQRNWIGKSTGVHITFNLKDSDDTITVYTTRPDTVYGIQYMVVAPEHPKVKTWVKGTEHEAAVLAFIEQVAKADKIDRTNDQKPKTGIFTGQYFTSPFTGETFPIWISDYVLMDYGTGAVMAVPAHDERDFQFAKQYHLPIKCVIVPYQESKTSDLTEAYTGPGIMVDSDGYTGMDSDVFKTTICDVIEEKGWGKKTVNYRLRDWLISRQRYWGTPIPMLYADDGTVLPEDLEQLPVRLPKDVAFTGQGNPLDKSSSFTRVERNGKVYRRETDTMDTFFDSSWYFLRFTDPHNTTLPFDKKIAEQWMPVGQYIGGIEHAILHLLYARFFTKVLRDLDLVSVDEPFQRLLTQGMVLKDGSKMSKSVGNTVDPGQIIEKYGADTARLFILFGAPVDRDLEWSDTGVEGSFRFLNRVFRLCIDREQYGLKPDQATALERGLHKTIKAVTEDIERFSYNTAISRLMELTNLMYTTGADAVSLLILVQLLAPFAPFMTEELWQILGQGHSVHFSTWPTFDADKTLDKEVTIVAQVNGKIRAKFDVAADISQVDVEALAFSNEHVKKYLDGMDIVKFVYIPKKLLNIVVKPK